ncbi:heavy metal translocating P-type ATPase [Algicella marina]|uniref:Cadmium-translocating P-type ATPase n=1 Tax=Algicella marina TaxID=2683284 RepID=A0A6P1T3I3_9RHOB|nr:heavy metal translocating P-type ATPase [Algicella marina]QHQ36321.1 cadmium-translocating P-type ATPase [Algicella marina]
MTAACPACAPMAGGEAQAAGPAMMFALPTIHCAACIGAVERELQRLSGVQTARVNLSLKRLSVTGFVAVDRVVAALARIGYEAYPLDMEVLAGARDEAGRSLLMRLAVAGFAMMNVMLLSVAVWSGAEDATRDLFHLLSAMIALPVIAYSGQPFFGSARDALRGGRLNMDVPISLAIGLAVGMSLFETLQGGAHAYFDAALSLTFFLLIGRYLDHRTRSAARSAAKELTALESRTAERVEADGVRTVGAADLRVGDVVLVPPGSRVPVDGELLSAAATFDRSFLTGESVAVEAHAGQIVQAGEINLSDAARVRATRVGDDTALRRMAALVETAENGRNRYTALADRAARIYAPVVHLLALLAFLGWYAGTGDARLAANVAIAVLIITCPCALGLAVPTVSTAAISRLFSEGMLVKHATALERLADVDHIIFDKTGTLTVPAVDCSGLSAEEKAIAAALAQTSHHPLARALMKVLRDVSAASGVENVTEKPGLGVEGRLGGQIVRLGRGAWLGAAFGGLGLRVGSAEARPVEAADRLRPGVSEALREFDLPGEVLTGDTPEAAERLAADVALPVKAEVGPEEKLRRIEALQGEGRRVLMVGDGLNDTAALAAAHASIAPATALDASRNAADMVFLTESMAALPLSLRVARAARALSWQNFAIAAVYNCIAVPVALAGWATPLMAALAMSASSISVVLNSQRMRLVK